MGLVIFVFAVFGFVFGFTLSTAIVFASLQAAKVSVFNSWTLALCAGLVGGAVLAIALGGGMTYMVFQHY